MFSQIRMNTYVCSTKHGALTYKWVSGVPNRIEILIATAPPIAQMGMAEETMPNYVLFHREERYYSISA